MKLLLFLLLAHSLHAFGDDQLERTTPFSGVLRSNFDLAQVARVMVIPTGDPNLIAGPTDPRSCQEGGFSAPPRLPLLPPIEKLGKWRVSFQMNIGGPKDVIEKTFTPAGDAALKSELRAFVNRDFASHAERLAAVGELCANKNELERLQLGAALGGMLGDIYDYSRANQGNNDVVTSEMQWAALKANKPSGVCRDAAATEAEFLIACGFEARRMKLEGYRTNNGGHEVLTVFARDGQRYTINWSELFSQDQSARITNTPQPGITNTDLFYTAYDPVTHRQIAAQRTELGNVLSAVTGGKTDNPNYLPDLVRLEATNGMLSLNAFQTETQLGDFARGASAYYRDVSAHGYLTMSLGVAYAHNRRDVVRSGNKPDKLQQEILYLQGSADFRPVVTLYEKGMTRLSLHPEASLVTEMYGALNTLGKDKGKSIYPMNTSTLGADLLLERGDLQVWGGGNVNLGMAPDIYHSQEADENGKRLNGPGVFVNRWTVEAGGQVRLGTTNIQASGEMIVIESVVQRAVKAAVKDRDERWRLGTVYSTYDPKYGKREDYLVFEAGGSWVLERAGTVDLSVGADVPVTATARGTAVKVTMKWKP